jgi:4'-phosphopantetheinyl transferase
MEEMLSPDERARAARFRAATHRSNFVERRATLRIGLGRLAGVAPGQIRFGYGSAGKPYVLAPDSARGLQFSSAHSGGLAVFACTQGSAVGVDVERVCQHDHLLTVAEACFSEAERTTLAVLPGAVQTAAFYRCWTRKEAYVKALGTGLGPVLQDFDVAFGEHEPPALVRVRDPRLEPIHWQIQALDVPAGFVGALVVRGQTSTIRWFDVTGGST